MILLLSLLALPAAAADAPPETIVRDAAAAYERGDFAAARDAYESLAAQGLESPALDHNLGDAYYRLGSFGKARLWYERSLALSPRDEDARHNRDTARERLGITDEQDPPLAPWASPLSALFTAVNVLFFALLAWRLRGPAGEVYWWARLTAGILWLVLGGAALAARRQAQTKWAIVTAPRLEARSGPGEREPAAFVVPEGRRVALLGARDGWLEIGVPAQGLKGWARPSEAEPVSPRP